MRRLRLVAESQAGDSDGTFETERWQLIGQYATATHGVIEIVGIVLGNHEQPAGRHGVVHMLQE
jgi:hypothetical protein